MQNSLCIGPHEKLGGVPTQPHVVSIFIVICGPHVICIFYVLSNGVPMQGILLFVLYLDTSLEHGRQCNVQVSKDSHTSKVVLNISEVSTRSKLV